MKLQQNKILSFELMDIWKIKHVNVITTEALWLVIYLNRNVSEYYGIIKTPTLS